MEGMDMKREVCKFFSGSFAALAYVHAAYAVVTSRGIIDEPVVLGRRWSVGYMWTEAAVYSAVSLALGYVGWRSKQPGPQQEPIDHLTNGQSAPAAGAAETSQLVTH
jgi:hypothetical protein